MEPRLAGNIRDLLNALIAVQGSALPSVISIFPINKIWRKKIVQKRQLETLETCVTHRDAQFFVNICKNNKRRYDLQIKFIYKKRNCF